MRAAPRALLRRIRARPEADAIGWRHHDIMPVSFPLFTISETV
jgi:hypothetical protein